MKKFFQLKSATKLALSSSAMIVVAMLVGYSLLASSYQENLRISGNSSAGPETWQVFQALLIPFLFAVPVSYIISAVILDRALNPIRGMIEKVKSIGAQNNFDSKIFIDSSEEELKEYAIAFNRMSSQISEYIEKQKQFISDASHELGTPLTVIVGHADMLLRWGKDDPKMLEDGLSIIKSEALAMNGLVEDLLFFARTDNRRMLYDRKPMDIVSLLRECAAEYQMMHPEFFFSCHTPEQLYIHGDEEAMRRVLRILFSNSVKYSDQVKEISAGVEQLGKAIKLSVSDRGIGIDPEYVPKIFNRFFRVDDSRTKETGGTGLGLAIAREILDAHGYSITAESVPGEGTTMIISLSSSNLHE